MNLEAAEHRIKELSDLLHHYNYLYYVKNESVVSDYEFDMLLKELEGLELNTLNYWMPIVQANV